MPTKHSQTGEKITTTITTTTFIKQPFFQDNLGKPPPESYTILDFTGPRDDWVTVAVASAGPYANHLDLTPDS